MESKRRDLCRTVEESAASMPTLGAERLQLVALCHVLPRQHTAAAQRRALGSQPVLWGLVRTACSITYGAQLLKLQPQQYSPQASSHGRRSEQDQGMPLARSPYAQADLNVPVDTATRSSHDIQPAECDNLSLQKQRLWISAFPAR